MICPGAWSMYCASCHGGCVSGRIFHMKSGFFWDIRCGMSLGSYRTRAEIIPAADIGNAMEMRKKHRNSSTHTEAVLRAIRGCLRQAFRCWSWLRQPECPASFRLHREDEGKNNKNSIYLMYLCRYFSIYIKKTNIYAKKIEKIFKRKKNFSENLVTERLQNGGNLLT